jgi:ABC-type glycerol-3-phosphate transport system permease component
MKLRGYIVALLMVCSLTPLAIAQSGMNAPTTEQYVPRLGDLAAAVTIVLPVVLVFVFLQRRFNDGMTAGAVKS